MSHAIFSIATNGYEKVFANCIQSQRDYADSLKVPYFLIEGCPPWGINAHDSAWLKLPILYLLLQMYSGGVLYLDADCEVMQDAADFRAWDTQEPNKSVFVSLDFSNRLNAAVIYCRSTTAGKQLAGRLWLSSFVPERFIPPCDRNLYENGHLIWILKGCVHLHVMPGEWNAGLYRELAKPNIVHHGGTVMRETAGAKPHSLAQRITKLWTALRLPFHLIYFQRCLKRAL